MCNSYRIKQTEREKERKRGSERERGREGEGMKPQAYGKTHTLGIYMAQQLALTIESAVESDSESPSAYLNPLCRFVCPSSSHVVLCRSSISIALTARRLAWFLCLSLSLPLSLPFLLFFSAGFGCQNHKITLSRSNTNTNTKPIQYPIPIPIPIPNTNTHSNSYSNLYLSPLWPC